MCGRYNIIDDPFTQVLLEELGIGGRLETRYNIAPTETVPAVRLAEGGAEMVAMRWWLIPHWAQIPDTRYSMFNARSETLDESRAFHRPFQHQRCILPASSFIEWHTEAGAKQPSLIRCADSAMAFAGLWDQWGHGDEAIVSCCIITTASVPAFSKIHNRMPVLLPQDAFRRWLDPHTPTAELMPLLLPGLATDLEVSAIDAAINNSRHKAAPQFLDGHPVLKISAVES